jgi:hypothetical protein
MLFDQLAAVFRSWCVHGTVTLPLLTCVFFPLLKSALKNPADPASYREIAGSSIILKLFATLGTLAVHRLPAVWLQGWDQHHTVQLVGVRGGQSLPEDGDSVYDTT